MKDIAAKNPLDKKNNMIKDMKFLQLSFFERRARA
jgi:hypothetical protein